MFSLNSENEKTYEILSIKNIPEQNVELVEISHKITKAKILLFVCDDENRVFNIAFKTPVDNSKGTPHILEHSVLCGSKKYNVKDPFVELAKGSINTFLNAMTFPDKTCYPVASANLKDFHNLVDVYLDAVFYPNVIRDKRLFMQEGWHYEIENIEDDLKVNGIVYNEMKGVYSDPDSIMDSAILSNLFRGTTYEYESGGLPSEIINLSYEEFVEFHHKYYSASNSIIMFYGKLDFNDELAKLEKEYLSKMDFVSCNPDFGDIKPYKKDEVRIDYYNSDSEDKKDKSYLAYSSSLGEDKTGIKNIILQMIDYILFASDSALLKNALQEAGFGESIERRLDFELKYSYYSIIAKNVDESKKDAFVKFIKDYISKILKDGIDTDMFRASINTLEFEYEEGEFSRMPRGLVFSLVALETYLYGLEPQLFIEYKDVFKTIKAMDFADKNNLFYKYLREVFIDNEKTVINVLNPKYNYSNEKEEILNKVLSDKKKTLSENDIKDIISKTKELKEFQNTKDSIEALRCIPSLKVTDFEKEKKLVDYTLEQNSNVDTIISYDNDKDVIYLSLGFDISDFSKEEIYLFSLINSLLGKIDLTEESYVEFNNYVDINTGGFHTMFEGYEKYLIFANNIKVMPEKIDIAFEIFYKLFSKASFADKDRIKLLIGENKTDSLLNILSAGHVAASNRAKSMIHKTSYIADKVSPNGIAHYLFMKRLSDVYEENYLEIDDAMELLYKKLHRRKMYLRVSMNKKYHDLVIGSFNKFTEKLIKHKMKHVYTEKDEQQLKQRIESISESIPFDDFDKKAKKEAIVTSNDVNFCAVASEYDKDDYTGRLILLKTLFNYEYLWTNIRVLGGAYGCMSQFTYFGPYSFASYRDPNLSKTNETFYGVEDYLKNIKKTDEEVEKYIIGSMGTFDNPLSTVDKFNKNIAAYYNGNSDEIANADRRAVLETKGKDINALSKCFEKLKSGSSCALVCKSAEDIAKKEYDLVWNLTA